MLGRLGTLAAVLTLGLAPSGASAAPRDVASTHAYLVAAYSALHATVTKWSSVEANIRKLDGKFRAECPAAGIGSPQSDEEQKLSAEVAGALWATGYHTNAAVVKKFVRAVDPLKWSNPAITRSARRYTTALSQMVTLPIPDLCRDIRSWAAGGFKAVPTDTAQYAHRVEAIEVKEVPRRLLAPYVQPADKGLLIKAVALSNRYAELEFTNGQDDWNTLLEVLALNQ